MISGSYANLACAPESRMWKSTRLEALPASRCWCRSLPDERQARSRLRQWRPPTQACGPRRLPPGLLPASDRRNRRTHQPTGWGEARAESRPDRQTRHEESSATRPMLEQAKCPRDCRLSSARLARQASGYGQRVVRQTRSAPKLLNSAHKEMIDVASISMTLKHSLSPRSSKKRFVFKRFKRRTSPLI